MGKKKDIEKFCSPENYSILIPYRDFENLVNMAAEFEEMKRLYAKMEERLAANQNMFSEVLEKVGDIYKLL